MILTLALLSTLMVLAPDTAIGRILWRGFVDAPARLINRMTRGHALLGTLLIAAIAGMVWMIGEESTRLLAIGAPDVASLLMMIDAASLLDAVLAAVLVATSVRVGSMRARIGGALRRLGGRTPRTRSIRTERVADNDDEEPRPALAALALDPAGERLLQLGMRGALDLAHARRADAEHHADLLEVQLLDVI